MRKKEGIKLLFSPQSEDVSIVWDTKIIFHEAD